MMAPGHTTKLLRFKRAQLWPHSNLMRVSKLSIEQAITLDFELRVAKDHGPGSD